MYKKFAFFICAAMGIAGMSHAQLLPCATDEHYHQMVKQYPQIAGYEQQFETQMAARLADRTTLVDTATIYTIPIVVHVIHDYGAENLSDNTLYTAAAYWADVYMKRNADTSDVITPFIPYVGNARIQLKLATIDPNGKPTKGIDRVNSYLTGVADDQAKYNDWPNNKYINIWLAHSLGVEYVGVAAYALLPANAAFTPFYDGVISLYNYTNPTTKTIPHELGHVLNLQHPWGNTNNPGVACGDDHVDDTPPTLGHYSTFCAASGLYDTTCATGYKKYYTSADGTPDSLVDYPDTANSQNIMDYTYCQRMFTKGQAVRMRTALTGTTAGRNNLITPANLALTGALAPMPDLPPVADYIVNHASPGGNNSLDKRTYFLAFNSTARFLFQNESWNDTVSSLAWTFSNGATLPTATTNTVYNSFSQPGWVTVSLTANSNAGTDTLVNTQAVYAADTTPAGTVSYTQDFTNEADIANWPMFNYYNNQFKWGFYNGAGVGDNSCIRFHSYDTSSRLTGIANGDHDDIYTPAFNLAGATGPVYLNFFSAGAYTNHGIGTYDPHQEDSLEIDGTVNGGIFWTKIAGFHTSELENNGSVSGEFVPTSAANWKARTVALPAGYLTNLTYFRFRVWAGNQGNDLYIDKFSISTFPAGVEEVLSATGTFDLFPNPANNGCSIIFKTGNSGMISYSVTDITGRVVFSGKKEYAPSATQQVEIPRAVTPVAGLYFVTVTIDGRNITRKLVVY